MGRLSISLANARASDATALADDPRVEGNMRRSTGPISEKSFAVPLDSKSTIPTSSPDSNRSPYNERVYQSYNNERYSYRFKESPRFEVKSEVHPTRVGVT